MLKSCRKMSMTVRSTPITSHAGPWIVRQTYSWMDRQGRPVSPPSEYVKATPVPAPPPRWSFGRYPKDKTTRKVDLSIEPGQSLGLMIRGGVEYGLGIFITGVDKDSVADRAGLMIGDQILEVNGQPFPDVTHDEAVNLLKYHKRMTLLVRDVGKVPHSCTAYDDLDWDSTTGARSPGRYTSRKPRSPAMQMVEEKARVVLKKSEFNTLLYYQEEYSAKQMTIEAFVAVLLELLNNPEKYTLLTELREVVVPEDRARFDELVYRREVEGQRCRELRDMLNQRENYRETSRRKGALLSDCTHNATTNLKELPPSEGHISRHSRSRASNFTLPVGGAATYDPYFEPEKFQTPSEDSGVDLANGSCYGSSKGFRTHSHSADSPESRTNQCSPRGTSDLALSNDEDYDVNNQELAHKFSRSFDMKNPSEEEDLGDSESANMRHHHSLQRLNRDPNEPELDEEGMGALVVPDQQGNLRITVKKTKPMLGIAIEGGANTKHPLPRIINIHENGAAFEAGGLEVGQLILEVNGHSVEGMHHQEVARVIAETFAKKDRQEIEFLVIEAKKSNLEPKPTALIFLEA